MGVAVGGLHFEDAVADFEHRDVERAAAEVIHGDLLVLLLVETVGERGGRGLVDDAEDFEAGDLAGVLGGLALGVVEVGGNGDDGLGDGFAKAHLGVGLELREDHRGNLRRAEGLGFAFDFYLDVGVAVAGANDLVGDALQLFLDLVELAAHEALHRVDGVARIGHRLSFGGFAYKALAVFREGDDRGGRAFAFGVFENQRLAALHDGHAGIRRAQINAKNLSHSVRKFVPTLAAQFSAQGMCRWC